MRILAIGDIHGCAIAFDTLIAAVKPQPNDKIVTLGDYVDKGPDSKGVIKRLIALHENGQLIALRGNHEVMILQVRNHRMKKSYWLERGGDATLASYSKSGKVGKLSDIPDKHWDFLENVCLDWYETSTHFFVHANAHAELALEEQPPSMLFWKKFRHPAPHVSGKTMVCGHTSQKSGLPINLGHAICIDTRVYGKGWLTCLDVTNGKVWQANQLAQQRTACIDDFIPQSTHFSSRLLAIFGISPLDA
ncbi:MAG: serine/threonine protein phosphatase [Tolypothrix sp. T3-bin4]|nr:serine/threonine protein phosphatase [Tolypothrix sp. T3-bin4]